MDQKITDLRQDYRLHEWHERDAHPNPVEQFKRWFNDTLKAEVPEPNAMALATATAEGKPAVRIVLLKDYDERGFVFFTNYESHKGQQLAENPWAAIVFWWVQLERQIRIEGKVEKVSEAESDQYFQSRPRESQLGAWASQQSQVIENREGLEQTWEVWNNTYQNQDIPRPPHWGGFRLVPTTLEFWQGRTSRLHDRLVYRRMVEGTWQMERLSP